MAFPTVRLSIHPDLAQAVECAMAQAVPRGVEVAPRSTIEWRGQAIRFRRRDTIEPAAMQTLSRAQAHPTPQ